MKNNTASKKKMRKKRSRFGEIWHRLCRNRGAMVGMAITLILVLMAVFADVLVDYNTEVIKMNVIERLQWPSAEHPFGTDAMGRDILARVIYGARYSLLIGISSIIFAVVIGVTLGAIAGYFGGIFENIIMRITDIVSSIPPILMAIVIVSALGKNLVNLIIAVGITSIPEFIRLTRSQVLTVGGQEYIEASKSIGLKERNIILKHVLPNCLSPLIVAATLAVAGSIMCASSLSFLGLGVPSPTPEWGLMLSEGREDLIKHSYVCLFPGLAIMITVLAFNLMGDGLRDALDPKLKR